MSAQRQRRRPVSYRTRVGRITIGTPAHCRRRCSEKAVWLCRKRCSQVSFWNTNWPAKNVAFGKLVNDLQASLFQFVDGVGADRRTEVAGMPEPAAEIDVLLQRLLAVVAEILDRAAALEVARVDHADGNEDEALEVAGGETDGVEHGVDAQSAVVAHQDHGRRLGRIGLGHVHLAAGGQLR